MSHPTIQKKTELEGNLWDGGRVDTPPVATTAYAPYNKERSLKRIVGDSAMRYLSANLSVAQLKAATGTTLGTYEKWAETAELPTTIDELGEDARLLWIGPRRLERVLLYLHGGAFLYSPGDFALKFWRYIQLELEKQNIEVGIAMLNYSLAPEASFPTPLKQAGLALDFLVAAGVKPQNLQLAGDSAGGNLVLQVLSQMLHPLQRVPKIRLSAPLRGMLIVSPMTNRSSDKRSTILKWRAMLPRVPEADRAFMEAVRAPEGWFEGADKFVDRVLVTAGGAELMRDDIVAFGEALKKHHADTELVVQKDGIHDDMFLDFMVDEKKLGSLTPLTIEWLAAGFVNA
ncbi:Abhydrolase-3 domain-containing protein [Mycena venus]|uniref:Abhydrolase-3 domain-containing protein n=1 Tax=Mycena venus TaxID=2733690 RepID=A0A8H6WT90_9AGAR|nr:Abhydrolase-3 domain-containing protein [Mycena venus]